MLTSHDEHWIRANAWSVEHDYSVHAQYLGEPFLFRRLLCFYDGETLFLCSRALPRQATDIDSACTQMLSTWPFPRPRRINCWGDSLPSHECLQELGYALIYQQGVNPINDEVVIDFNHGPSIERLERRHQEVRRRTRGYECRATKRKGLSWNEISLLRRFALHFSSQFDSVDLSYYLTVPHFLASRSSERTIRVELTIGNEIRGLALASVLSDRFGALHIAVCDRKLPGAYDTVYASVMSEVEKRQIRTFSLGLTLHEGLRRYKLKWGGPAYRRWASAGHLVCSG